MDKILQKEDFGDSVFHSAAYFNKVKTLRFLLKEVYSNDDKNYYLNEKNKLGFTPLHSAVAGLIDRVERGIFVQDNWNAVNFILEQKTVDWEEKNKFNQNAGQMIENDLDYCFYENYMEIVDKYYPE